MLLLSQFSHVPFFMDLRRICSHANECHFIRGFIKVLNRRATEFDTWAKNWHAPPENFEILWLQGCVFLHFEAADNDFQQPKKDNFSRQFNHN